MGDREPLQGEGWEGRSRERNPSVGTVAWGGGGGVRIGIFPSVLQFCLFVYLFFFVSLPKIVAQPSVYTAFLAAAFFLYPCRGDVLAANSYGGVGLMLPSKFGLQSRFEGNATLIISRLSPKTGLHAILL